MKTDSSSRPLRSSFYLNGWLVDPGECTLCRTSTDEKHKITPKAMSVLLYLAERAGKVVSTEEILSAVWDNSFITPNAVQKTISEIRRVLAEDARSPEILLTVPKRGYKILLALQEVPPEGRGAAGLMRLSMGELPAWQKAIAGAGALALLVTALFFVFTPVQSPEQDDLQLKVFENEQGDRLGLLVSDASGDVGQLATLRSATNSTIRLLGYLEHSRSIVSPGESLPHLTHTAQLQRIVRITPSEDGVLLESFPFAGDLQFTRILEEYAAPASIEPLLQTLLDPEDQERMTRWNTRSPEAYRLAREAVIILQRANVKSMREAQPLLQSAIEADPQFGTAYAELGYLLTDIAKLSTDLHQSERARNELLDLIDRAQINGIADEVLQSLRFKLQFLSTPTPVELEERLSKRLMSDPHDVDALFEYSGLLSGAGFADEALAYATLSAEGRTPEEARKVVVLRSADVWPQIDREKANEQALKHLESAPNDYVSLYGMVLRLALLGRFAESEQYLERLKISDNEGQWAFSGEVTLKAIRGDYSNHPEELEADLANPLQTNMTLGRLHFFLGDVDAGIAAWMNVEPSLRWLHWRYAATNEINFPPEVAKNPKYQRFMDDIGVGPRWRTYLRGRLQTLASVTGVPVTTQLPGSDVTLLASR